MANPFEQVIKITGSTEEYERAVKRTTELTEKLSDKIKKGNAVSAGSVAPIIQQHELLRREIVRVSGSIENASPQMRAQYDAITAKVRSAVSETRSLTKVVQQQTGDFHSWGQIIEANSGRFGALGSSVVAVSKNLGLLAVAFKVTGEAAKTAFDHAQDAVAPDGDAGAWDMLTGWARKQNDIRKKGLRQANRQVGDTIYDLFAGAPDPDFAKSVKSAQIQYPLRPTDDQLLQASAVTSERLRKEAEAEKQKAEAALKSAEALEKLTIAKRAELELLKASDPFQEAEIKYLHDLKLAGFEATEELRKMARAKAEVIRAGSIDKAFGDLSHDILGTMMDRSKGVARPGDEDPAVREEIRLRHDSALATAYAIGEIEDRALEERIQKWSSAQQQISYDFADIFTDLAVTGGENFGRMAAQRFGQLTQKGFETLFASLFQPKQGKDGQFYLPGSSKGYATEEDALKASEGRIGKAQAAVDIASVGVGAYGSARAGEGSRTGSLVSGAISGAAAFPAMPVVGAIVGAIAGAIGGYLGEQQRQSEYKYGVPSIDKGGQAHFTGYKNIDLLERTEILTRIQDKYDSIRNAYAKIFISADESILDDLKAIDGRFQKEGSANFLKHLDQWINGGLGREVAFQVKGGLEQIFSTVGVGADRFNELWKKFGSLDPAKAAALFGELYSGMKMIQDAGKFFDRKGPTGLNTSYFGNMIDERKKMNRSVADVMEDEHFTPILKVARGISELVGEEQIHAITEIARLQEQAKNAQIAAIQEIIRISDAATERKKSALENYDILGIQHGQGTDDEKRKREADYYKAKVDEELRKVDTSKTAAEADLHSQRAQDYINKILGLGYDINEKTGEEWRQWAIDATNKVDAVLMKQLDDLGIEISNANAEFWLKFNEIYGPFKEALEKAGDDIGENFDPGKFDPEIGEIKEKFELATVYVGQFSTAITDATTRLANLGRGNTEAGQSAGYSNVVSLHDWSQAREMPVPSDSNRVRSGLDDVESRLELIADLLAEILDHTAATSDNTSGMRERIAAVMATARSRSFAAATAASREF